MKRLKYLLLLIIAVIMCFTTSSCEQVIDQIRDQTQCKAITKNGTRCSNKKGRNSDYCKVHRASKSKASKNKSAKSNGKCKAKTKSGKRCSRSAVKGGYCSQHYKSR